MPLRKPSNAFEPGIGTGCLGRQQLQDIGDTLGITSLGRLVRLGRHGQQGLRGCKAVPRGQRFGVGLCYLHHSFLPDVLPRSKILLASSLCAQDLVVPPETIEQWHCQGDAQRGCVGTDGR